MRVADDEIKGPLPIEVEVMADEFYSGPKPSNPDELLGVIRGRNINMVPVLQSVAQIKALFQGDKWETLFDTCATVCYLGSGPTANSTHKWISEILGKRTIDTRTEGLNRGRNTGDSLNFSKAGLALLEPAEVKRMPRDECIILIEGQYPIYDEKAKPFDTEAFKQAIELGDYIHPVEAIYDEEKMEYITIQVPERKAFRELGKEEVEYYTEKAKTDPGIKLVSIDKKDMLYLNWNRKPRLSEEEIIALYRSNKKDISKEDLPQDAKRDERENIEDTKEVYRNKCSWSLEGSIYECIKRYAVQLSEEELEQIFKGIESGLSEKQIKAYFSLSLQEMEIYRRAYEQGGSS
ncbi:TraG/TraD/VirD4 family protein [Lachnospiraceae bacterium PAL227]|uniref:TraG/TraD/VirD4 family protein n=2 Tax=Ohessyouella blattaphilus TaxID=2949333 RepID=A0ABT1EIN2_9FIRM|nr:TraG/TraD/VirD4 family protein [Ohessyouella blattaphilus]MCR8563958.1 TraG/TraD/VirD4 family protein [Ohessyouella blattaphilus]